MIKGNMTLFINSELKDDEPNKVTYAAIESAEKKEDICGPYDSVEELMEALNASTTRPQKIEHN